jgi:hypothetical protein
MTLQQKFNARMAKRPKPSSQARGYVIAKRQDKSIIDYNAVAYDVSLYRYKKSGRKSNFVRRNFA